MESPVTHECHACEESIPIDERECPHCGANQVTNKGTIATILVFGLLGLGMSYLTLPGVVDSGVPGSLAEGVTALVILGVGLVGPFFVLAGLAAYRQRARAVDRAQDDG